MLFVRQKDLKIGMRLARPIYNKQGVLLFERDSKLTTQAIQSIANFGLLGVYILEPAEPVPPMSEDDMEFERFQTMTVFSLQEEMEKLLNTGKTGRMQNIADGIIRKFGHLDRKINMYQNLRSKEDFVYKHSMNVAILCALITHTMNLRVEELYHTVKAAVVHDIGTVSIYQSLPENTEITPELNRRLNLARLDSGELTEKAYFDGGGVRRICTQATRAMMEADGNKSWNGKLVTGAKVLLVANRYDEMTAMKIDSSNTDSEIRAIKELMSRPDLYDPAVVDALVRSINIIFPGVSVELNTGEKALVITENQYDILRPVLLSFSDNSILDLSRPAYSDIHIVDIMKTLDNRYIMDPETLRQAGLTPQE